MLSVYLFVFINSAASESNYYGQQRLERVPHFLSTPSNNSYREGSAVRLTCEATAKPQPVTAWYFKGEQIRPTHKYSFNLDNSVLSIYPFQKSDVGRYICVASNRNGQVQHFFELKILNNSAPLIVDSPESKTVNPGEQVTFVCRVNGQPPPSIKWYFRGAEISREDLHFEITQRDNELTIIHATREDEGVYQCTARNVLGMASADATLKVYLPNQQILDESLSSEVLKNIVKQAKENVDRAINQSKSSFNNGEMSPWEFMKMFKFNVPQNVALTKAREIYEQSLLLVQQHVHDGLKFPTDQLPTNFSFESVLAVSHIQTIMELSGCVTGPFRNPCTEMCLYTKYRTYDGQCNNMEHQFWGVAQTPFRRNLPPIYENGFNTPVGWNPEKLYFGFKKPNPRLVSIKIISTEEITPHLGYTAMMKQWGQFLAHDIEQTAPGLARQTYMKGAICNRTCENLDPCYNVPIPPEDPRMQGEKKPEISCIEVERSSATCGSGQTGPIYRQLTYREQMNILTAFIDGSGIYGSAEVDALDLRDLFGDHGLLRFDIVSETHKPYLPFERESSMECRRNRSHENPISCFLAGDYRANEQVVVSFNEELALLSMHTLWLREHNRIATKFLEINPHWDGETIYQETRKLIGAMLQVITYEHWLPKVLGPDGYAELIGPYKGYDSEVNPTLANSFSSAALRFGHTIVNPVLYRLNKDFQPIKEGHIPLHEAFFAPERLLSEGGIDPLLRGLFAMPMKTPKEQQLVNKELTDKLFSRVEESMYDLATINIQRGRDHGLPGYVAFRRWCNFSVPETWDDLTDDIPDNNIRAKLEELYGHPGNIDLWVGLILERRLAGALVGPTIGCILGDQFRRLRSGDRFWYENEGIFTALQLQQIRKATLAAVLCNSGDYIDRVQRDVFEYKGDRSMKFYENCELIPQINLNVWQSCCERGCVSSTPEETQGRKRRAHQAFEKQMCMVGDKMKKNGDVWKLDECTACECKVGQIWCSVEEGCRGSLT
uniref:Ig-like domain-containing protein n=1 Tax=Setaria digitata TaxID=48799 RepID=A0A915Q5C4_9BILA